MSPLGSANGESNGIDRRATALRITIRDSGEGIRAEDIPHESSIRSSPPKTTERDLGYRRGTESFRSTEENRSRERTLDKGKAFTFRSR